MSAEEAQNIVEDQEEFSPDEIFDSAFADEEQTEEAEETSEDESTETENTADAEDSEDSETTEEDSEEGEELSALELAEKKALDKYKEGSKDGEEGKVEDSSSEEDKEVKDEPVAEIDFTDVDSDPGKFINDLIDSKVEDDNKKTRLKETIETYPEIGELTALVARELIGRQTVKMVDGPSLEIPEEYKEQIESYATIQKQLEEIQADRVERAYFDAIEKEVPGARAINSSDSFLDWLDQQSVGINMLAKSGDPTDAVSVLQAYKEFEARAAAKKADEAGAKRKAKVDSSNKRVVQSSGSKTISDAKDDFNAGFDS